MSHVFISYSRSDSDYLEALIPEFERRGIEVWYDNGENGIDVGDDWSDEIFSNIRSCQAFVVLMSPDADASEWVKREVLYAQKLARPIFPLLLSGEEFPLLITTQYEDVKNGETPSSRFFERLERILNLRNENNSIESIIQPIDIQINKSDLKPAHIEADYRLLYELWKLINTVCVRDLVQSWDNNALRADFFRTTLDKYLRLRRLQKEKHFFNPKVEEAFLAFDVIAENFVNDLLTNATSDGTFIVWHHKYQRLDRETRLYLELQNEISVQNSYVMLEQHNRLVEVIRWEMSEFDFPNDLPNDVDA